MAKQTSAPAGEPDPLTVMAQSIEELNASADRLGVAQWRTLRSIRKDLNGLIRKIEAGGNAAG